MRWVSGFAVAAVIFVLLFPMIGAGGEHVGTIGCESYVGISLLPGPSNCGVAGQLLPLVIAATGFLATVFVMTRSARGGNR